MSEASYSKRCWFTFPTRSQVEQPIIWQMSQKFPKVSFDIRQASVQNEIGIMAVLLVVGFICNYLVRPLDERHYVTTAEAAG